MTERSLFTTFWTNESTTTRKVLAKIPEGSDYRPDPKSRTAHEIAWQIVCEEKMIIEALETGKAEWAPPPLPATMKEVLKAYEEQSAGMAGRWGELADARWDGTLEFFGRQRPASAMAWSAGRVGGMGAQHGLKITTADGNGSISENAMGRHPRSCQATVAASMPAQTER